MALAKKSVSVVMSAYNGADYITEQVRSILDQSYPIKELIIADDGSIDDTPEVIRRLAALDNRIQFYQNVTNMGYNKSFENILHLAHGDLIAIADQDDVWHIKKIETLLSYWKDDTLLIYSDSVRFKDKVPESPVSNSIVKHIEGNNVRHLSVYNTVSGHAMMIKRKLLDLASSFDKDVYYDWWLAAVAMVNGGITYVPSILVFQREHDSNVTIRKRSKAERFKDYKTMLIPHLKKFQTITGISKEDQLYFKRLEELWSGTLEGKNRWQLFFFLMKYRKEVFEYKIRKLPFISHLKHSFRFSFKKIR